MSRKSFCVVQPWGRDKAKESTVVAEFKTVEEAFAKIDDMAEQMMRTGAASDSVELVVVDEEGRLVRRPQEC